MDEQTYIVHERRISSLEVESKNYNARLDTMMNTIHNDMRENKEYHREQIVENKEYHRKQIDEMKKSHNTLSSTVGTLLTHIQHIKWMFIGVFGSLVAFLVTKALLHGDLTMVELIKTFL